MDYYLVKDARATFYNEPISVFTSEKLFKVALEPCHVQDQRIRNIYGDKLFSLLKVDQGDNAAGDATTGVFLKIRISVTAFHAEENFDCKGGNLSIICFTSGQDSFLGRVKKVGDTGMVIRIIVRSGPSEAASWMLSSKIPASKIGMLNDRVTNTASCGFSTRLEGTLPKEITHNFLHITGTKMITGFFTLVLELNDTVFHDLLVNSIPSSPPATVLQDMLENEKQADILILPRGGRLVKCHRAILSSRSPVFDAMLQLGTKEALTNSIQIPEMSESVVRHFLKYLYTWGVKGLVQDSRLTLEMLKAGNSYQVWDLIRTIHELLMIKREEWLGVEVAVDILLFTRSLCDLKTPSACQALELPSTCVGNTSHSSQAESEKIIWREIRLRAVQVLKWHYKEKPVELMRCEKLTKFYKETPRVAMELHMDFLQFLDMEAKMQ